MGADATTLPTCFIDFLGTDHVDVADDVALAQVQPHQRVGQVLDVDGGNAL